MKAVQYRKIGSAPEVVEVEDPKAPPGGMVLEVTASGLCHSDEFVMSLDEKTFATYGYDLPMTLGHETAGRVVELGEGTTGVEVGDNVLVYGCWGCGVCDMCARGNENHCRRGMVSPGFGAPGGMAEYIPVDSVMHIVPIGDLDPIKMAPLNDAGLTPYAAIKRNLHRLRAGATAVVIGAGGLGHVAIQLLRRMSDAQVIALDLPGPKLAFAKEVGAHHALVSEKAAAEHVKELTQGHGADLVLDFVAGGPTPELAIACGGMQSAVVFIGAGDGHAKVGFGITPWEMSVSNSLWGSRLELMELVQMAMRQPLEIRTTPFPLDLAPMAYRMLHERKIDGRAVCIP
ncbi:NAD(P)-dependent alcohol dehydrogenase [Luteococcus sp. OSA5]|uniref:NAD(P)-dependent alcohol dehydrogenase n=1 Tax=Luteococcus sp. OSA5 TaxID=3401630 RepID=UPI003B43041E